MTGTKIIGFAAVTALILGYGGMFATVAAAAMDLISRDVAVILALGLGLVGEGGLWVAAATLGWTLFARRKALLERLMGRKRPAEQELV
ncbi:MAG TPA: hypothetical protein PLE81_04080 [Brevundimonas sp.]|jgi:hypothetical protein|uniref:hypothetical protein n=1 Tax=Brevundimonas sp. TaxID=1871086 RepID=UPI002B5CEBE9|nr:hypothetical protein [Brevundimonas sp.]HRH19799.1 hypothetical protein [Brevundimonas sp.]